MEPQLGGPVRATGSGGRPVSALDGGFLPRLGAPIFYLYPPLPFWIDALISIVTFDALPVSYRLAVAAAVILWLSGLAMHVAPALLLQDWISAAWLWSWFYRIEAWFFFTPSLWPKAATMQVVVR